jgi:cell division protein FtsB
MKAKRPVPKKKSSLVLKLFVIVFAVYAFYRFADFRIDIAERQKELATLESQIEEQKQKNAELSHILNSETDDEYMEKIARDKLGYAFPNERIFINGG